MSTKAEKFIIALQAQYEGSEQVKELQSDLDALGQVEKLQKYTAELDTLTLEMQKGAAAASEMKAVMDGSFDPKLAARLEKTQTRVQELSVQYERQRTTLGTYADALARARDTLQKFESGMGNSPTAGEQAKLAKLADTVQQGASGAAEILAAIRDGREVKSSVRRNMDLNGGRGKSPAQFFAMFDDKVRSRMERATAMEPLRTTASAEIKGSGGKTFTSAAVQRLARVDNAFGDQGARRGMPAHVRQAIQGALRGIV